MTLSIRPANPARPDFVGEVSGVDIRAGVGPPPRPRAIEAGMDRYGVLVFRGQDIDDAQQIAFSRHFGPLEMATGDIVQGGGAAPVDGGERHLQPAPGRQRHGAGRPQAAVLPWQHALALRQQLQGDAGAIFPCSRPGVFPGTGGNTEFADMRAAWDALDPAMQAQVRDLITEHSQIYSRGVLGFTEFTEEELAKWRRCRQRLVRRHPRDRAAVAVPLGACRRHPGLAGAGGARPAARPDGARDAARIRPCPCLAAA